MHYKYTDVSLKKRFLILCIPLATAIICTACNNAYAAAFSNDNPDSEIVYSQPSESSDTVSEDSASIGASTDISEPEIIVSEPDYTITDEMYEYFDEFANDQDFALYYFINFFEKIKQEKE